MSWKKAANAMESFRIVWKNHPQKDSLGVDELANFEKWEMNRAAF